MVARVLMVVECLISILFVLIAYKYTYALEDSIFEMFQVFLLFISMSMFLICLFFM